MIPSQVAGKLLRSGAASGGNNGDNGNGEDLNVLEQFQPNAHNGGMTPPHITATITPSPSYHQQTEEGETESPSSVLDYVGDALGGLVSSPTAAINDTLNLAQWIVKGGEEPTNPDDKWGQLWEYTPKTAAGEFTKEVGTFLAGFGAGGALLKGGKILQGTTKLAKIGRGMAQGAFSDFMTRDGHEERLSNLLSDHPNLLQPVAAYLAAKEDDSELLGRVKNAAEGLVIGGVLDMFLAGVKAVKGMHSAKTAAEREAVHVAYDSELKAIAERTGTDGKEALAGIPSTQEIARQLDNSFTMKEAAQSGGILQTSPPHTAGAVDSVPSSVKATTTETSPPSSSPHINPATSGKIKAVMQEGANRGTTAEQSFRDVFDSVNLKRHKYTEESRYKTHKLIADSYYDATLKGQGVERHKSVIAEGVRDFQDMGYDCLDAFLATGAEKLSVLRDASKFITQFRTVVHGLVNEGSELGAAVKAGTATDAEKYMLSRLADLNQEFGRLTKDMQTSAARATSSGQITIKDSLVDWMFGKNGLRNKLDEEARTMTTHEMWADMAKRGWNEDTLKKYAADMEMMKGDVKQAARHMNTFNTASYLGVLNESRINGILFSPVSWVADAVGSAIKTAWLPIDQMVGGAVSLDMHQVRQGARTFGALFSYLSDSFRMAGKAFKTGDNLLDRGGNFMAGEGMRHQITYENLKALRNKTLGKAPDAELSAVEELLCRQAGWVGTVLRFPSRVLLTTEEFFKQVNFRASLHAQLYDMAFEQGMKDDKNIAAFIANGLKECLDAQTGAAVVTPNSIAKKALEYARKATWTQPLEQGSYAADFQTFANKHPGMRLVVPFIKTPANILRDFTAHTPGLNLVSSRYREALAKGGEEAARATGQMATGCLLWASAGMLAYNGIITGSAPKDPKLRKALEATGWQPYSIKVGNSYVSYRRYDPIGMFLGMAADFNVIASESNERDAGQIASAMAAALTNNLSSKTYLQGLAETLEVLQDPSRHGERYAGNMLSSFIPMTSLLRFTRQNMTDDAMRETRDIMDYVMNGLPGFSDTLPARHSWITGEAVNYQMFPKASDNMVLRELANMADRGVIGTPSKNMRGVELTTTQLSRLNEIHGTVRVQGKTMQEALERLFLSPSYDLSRKAYLDPPKGGDLTGENISPLQGKRAYEINKVIRKYRKAAQNQLMKEDTELSRMVALRNRNVKLARDGKTDGEDGGGGGERSPFKSLLEYY